MIALIDCNNFYVSCERVFQAELRNKPVIVLSNNDGCAISRSEEAKALDIEMGTPAFMIEALIEKHNVQVRSSNYTLYDDMSDRVMRIIKSFVPKVEVYSIDELFVDLSGLKYHNLEQLSKDIRRSIMQSTHIPVCVGIAPTKVLAKMANRYAKKTKRAEGVHCAHSQELINEMLRYTEVGNIWGIGRQHEKLLLQHGFKSAADFIQAPEEWVRKHMAVVGQRLLHELKGISCIKWEDVPKPKKNICTARSFGRLLTSLKDVQQAVAAHTASCGAKLRNEGSCAQRLQVSIQTNIHRRQDQQCYQSIKMELPVPTNSTAELMKYSMQALHLIFQPGYNYNKAGVMVLDLIPQTNIQTSLFDTENRQRDQQLMQALDSVNETYGRDAVRFGVQGYGKRWKLKQEKLSGRYTTRIKEIMKVKAG